MSTAKAKSSKNALAHIEFRTKKGMARVRELLQSVAILAVQAQTEIDCGFDVQCVETIELIEGDMANIASELNAIAKARQT
jgi:hypothetical protein